MGAAIVALVGVVIGGLLTAVLNYVLEARHVFRRARTGARLVQEELAQSSSYLQLVLTSDTWSLVGNPFHTEVWKQYREVLAEGLSPYEWLSVQFAYSQLEHAEEYYRQSL